MTTYSAADRAAAMRRAGFPESSIPLGTAISLAELGPQSDVTKVFGDNGTSIGPWQIHLPAHPDVTSACAMDLDCSTRAAYRISSGGTNWNPWGAFTDGRYKQYLEQAANVSSGAQDQPPTAETSSSLSAGSDQGSPLTGFQFPTLNVGGIFGQLAASVLLKLAATVIALGFVFVGVLKITGLDADEAIRKGITKGA